MQELLLVNPSRRRRRVKKGGGTSKQRAWRKKFGAMYGGKKRRSGARKRRHSARRSGLLQSVVYRKSGKHVSRRSFAASGYRRNPRRRSHRRYRNPSSRFGLPSARNVMGTVTQAFQGAVGATLVDVVMGQITSRGLLPSFAATEYGYPLTKGALAIGLAALAEAVVPRPLRGFAAEMARGSITVTLTGLLRNFVPSTLPLGARGSPMRRFGYGSSGYIPQRTIRGMGEYLSGASASEERKDYYPSWDSSMGEYMKR